MVDNKFGFKASFWIRLKNLHLESNVYLILKFKIWVKSKLNLFKNKFKNGLIKFIKSKQTLNSKKNTKNSAGYIYRHNFELLSFQNGTFWKVENDLTLDFQKKFKSQMTPESQVNYGVKTTLWRVKQVYPTKTFWNQMTLKTTFWSHLVPNLSYNSIVTKLFDTNLIL